MFGDAIEYPFDTSIETYLLGWVCLFLSILIFPLIFVYGYYMKIYRKTLAGDEEPPEFPEYDIGELGKDGLVYILISLAYFLVPLLFTLVGFAIFGVALEPEAMAGGLFAMLGIATLAYMVFGYFLPAATVSYADTDDLAMAFSPEHLFDVTITKKYALAYLFVVGFGIVMSIGMFLIMMIPILGWFIQPVIAFYMGMVASRIFASAYGSVTGQGTAA